ncbi:IclR family transcriptional regulator [Halomarina pelagica]|uniref:IclR family transcriptional regulator n=1 Tax=Halomarina pelagica TaxID=2961599 RepID=UPI0020C39A25|nr:IclR family transcriptional regulator [Halomarina sp. BND7]
MIHRTTTTKPVKSTETVFDIIESLKELDGARVTELADHLGLAKSTVYSQLFTLRKRGYVVKEGDRYHLSLEFAHVGEYTRTRRPSYELAGRKVAKLAEETGERSQFIVEEHGRGIYVHRETGANAVRTDSAIGGHVPLHATASGKAILAHLPDERVDGIIEYRGLPRQTDHTITDEATLREELRAIRERGYAFNQEENTERLHAVGVPVRLPDDRVLGAISVSGPTYRMKGERLEEEVLDLLLGTANELELNIAYL